MMSRKMSRGTSSNMYRTSSARKWVSLRRMGSSAYSGEARRSESRLLVIHLLRGIHLTSVMQHNLEPN
jgi:hypothetical protein